MMGTDQSACTLNPSWDRKMAYTCKKHLSSGIYFDEIFTYISMDRFIKEI